MLVHNSPETLSLLCNLPLSQCLFIITAFLKHPSCLKFATGAGSGCVRVCESDTCLHGMSADILHICCTSVSVALWGCKCIRVGT